MNEPKTPSTMPMMKAVLLLATTGLRVGDDVGASWAKDAFSAIYFIAASASDLTAVSTDQTVTGPACIGSSKVTVTAADMANRALYLSATELATYYTSGTDRATAAAKP